MMIKRFSSVIAALALLVLVAGCNQGGEAPAKASELKLETPKERISYTIGFNIGNDFSAQEIDVEPEIVLTGIKDAMETKEPRLTEEEMVAEVESFQKAMQTKMEAKIKELSENNKAEGEAFLDENAKKEGVQVTESGLQYKVIEPGEGDNPAATDMVTVHYRGTLIDGTQFDSSIDRGQPATFPVGGVIPGWTEALQLMKPGAKYQLFIPSELAYGERGAGPDIGPNSTLVFDVELISVEAGGN